jgi:hypothetical protein
MRHRLLRISLVLVAVAAAAAAGYAVWDLDQQIAANRAAERAAGDQARALLATIGDARAGQQAYVAQGQGAEFWTARVAALQAAFDLRIRAFETALTSEGAHAAIEAAASAMEDFRRLDASAREYVETGQSLMASDLIFSDGLETTAAAAAQVNLGLEQEIQAQEASLGGARRRQIQILAGASGLVLLVLLLLVPGGRRAETTESGELHIAPRMAAGPAQAEAPPPASTPDLSGPLIDLTTAARLCTDLGRVAEPRELAGLLQRAAQLIEASGMIVWIADPSGSTLRPVATHGYSDQVVARMGSIPKDAANVMAAAYRTAELRAIRGEGGANGAVVAPLMGPGGCVGVLSAELWSGGEAREAVRAVIAIIAAQLSTVVAAPPAVSSDAAPLDRASAR